MEVCKTRIYRKSVFRPDITCYCYKYLRELKLFIICHKKPFGNQLLHNVYVGLYEKNAQLIHLRDNGSIINFIFIIHFYSIMYILP